MAQIAISDEVASTLAAAAISRGCDQGDLASALLKQALHEESEALEFSPDLAALLLRRVQQSQRGEVITSEEVDAKFEALFRELEAR